MIRHVILHATMSYSIRAAAPGEGAELLPDYRVCRMSFAER